MLLQYILKLSISISVVYLFYQLLLRRLTFYNWNRWYLLIYSMVCLVIPFVNVFTIVAKPLLQQSPIIRYIPAIEQMTTTNEAGEPAVAVDAGFNAVQLIIVVIGAGMVFMILRLLVQYYSLFKMRSKAVLLYNDNVKLYHIDKPIVPFSFGKSIYINQQQHSEEELKEIIRHEFIHVKQRHSADIIWSELLCIINWYNPFAWLLRKALRQNLEFIADEKVLQTGFDRKQYQYLLLKVIGVHSFSIATNFNFSSLKKRIAMMNKTKTAKVHLIRFLFMLPLLLVILLAFRNSAQQQQQQPLLNLATDTIPAAPIAPKLPDDVVTIDVNDDQATVRLKNGQIEKYNLTIPKEKKAFEKKYGPLPKPPVPPTPPTSNTITLPAPPAKELAAVVVDGAPAPPAPPVAPQRVQMGCFTKKGYYITIADNNGECVVIIKDKQKKIVEAVTLTDWNKDPQYEGKYGEIPASMSKPSVSAGSPMPAVAASVSSNPVQVAQQSDASSVTVSQISVKPTAAVVSSIAKPSRQVTYVNVSLPGATGSQVNGRVSAVSSFKVQHRGLKGIEEELASIGKYTTKEELEQIGKRFKEKGFNLKVESADYKNGYLTGISIRIYERTREMGAFSTNDLSQTQVIIMQVTNDKGNTGISFFGKNYEAL